MRGETAEILSRAHAALAAARRDLAAQDAPNAISRAYYATFYAAVAALNEHGLEAKSHRGTHGLFAEHFVRTALFDREMARTLSALFQQRQEADYAFRSAFSLEAVREDVQRDKAFVEAIEAWLRSTEAGG